MKTTNDPQKLSVWSQLYRGRNDFAFVEYRKRWYIASGIILAACVVVMLFKGFVLGIDFAGGNQFNVTPNNDVSLEEVEDAAEDAGAKVGSGQEVGSGDERSYVVRTAATTADESQTIRDAIAEVSGVESGQVSETSVSATWGQAVSQQALVALAVFLVLVTVFIWIRFERRMAWAALIALAHDLVLTAGVFSLVGFEVTPSTIVGMLMILGYSLYDTVVVFDKLQENTKNLLNTRRKTYSEATNDAINQTLMRSLNTSLIGALPVAGLLFIGVGMLGVGTLRDLALVLFVGIITGTYSSIFLAAPVVADMANRSSEYKRHNRKVHNKRTAAGDDDGADDGIDDDDDDGIDFELEPEPAAAGSAAATGNRKSRRSRN
ncbi:protein translocase subunit SecF [Haloglycomyces albus]|uniref:protein translocase subunit SecF n=1 Tax=Haloglycomyces albus TaxID=526067 RepID=UPI00046D7BF5|nr:protein translocase subunit SecF [Haloglycomyces albus]